MTDHPDHPTFELHDYNRHGVLAINLWMILAFIFLTRNYWLALGALFSQSGYVRAMIFEGRAYWALLAELPALLVAGAGILRKPEAGRLIRTLWRYGPVLLAVSAMAGAVLALGLAAGPLHLDRLPPSTWVEIALAALVVGYLLLVPRVRLTFAEFPAPPASSPPS